MRDAYLYAAQRLTAVIMGIDIQDSDACISLLQVTGSNRRVVEEAETARGIQIGMLMIAFIGGVKANPDEFVRRNRRILDLLLSRDAAAAAKEIRSYIDIGFSEVAAFIAAQAESGS